jgi:hypothetical protein
LAGFGTRQSLSSADDPKRGVGAARYPLQLRSLLPPPVKGVASLSSHGGEWFNDADCIDRVEARPFGRDGRLHGAARGLCH